MSNASTKPAPSELILQQLRHPLKLRISLCVAIILVWYVGFFSSVDEETKSTSATITRERKRIATAKEIETLRTALAPHHELIRAGVDLNELMRHVIDHLRSSPLKLVDLKPEASKDLGPYQAIGVQLTLEGQFVEIDAFLGWVESGERPLRVDAIKINLAQQNGHGLKIQVTLLGLAEKTPTAARPTAAATKAEPAKSKN